MSYGDNPELHRIVDGKFVCSAPEDAPCRTLPTCDCEYWCGDRDEAQREEHRVACVADGGEPHCCMDTVEPGRPCWLADWLTDCDLGETYSGPEGYGQSDEWFPDGPVATEWDGDGVTWSYSDDTKLRAGCDECCEPIREDDLRATHGMCGSCVHDAMRSGWDPGPERLPNDPDQPSLLEAVAGAIDNAREARRS